VKQKRTDILHASIRLAWNIVFSGNGRKATVQTLFEKWISAGGGVIDSDDLLAEAVWEVITFERTHSLTVEVCRENCELTEVDGVGQSVRIKLTNYVSDVQQFTAQDQTCVREEGAKAIEWESGKRTRNEKSEEGNLEVMS